MINEFLVNDVLNIFLFFPTHVLKTNTYAVEPVLRKWGNERSHKYEMKES